MTTVRVSFAEVIVHGHLVGDAGIHRRCCPNLAEDSQIFVAFTMYANLTKI